MVYFSHVDIMELPALLTRAIYISSVVDRALRLELPSVLFQVVSSLSDS